MTRQLTILALLLGSAAFGLDQARADSWIFRPSTYSHDPDTGQRVAQYAQEKKSYLRQDDTYMESGYRHILASLRTPGGGYDQMHIVQTWGAGESIRPYGEWEFPYRAGATPYGPWGNPQGPWTLPFDSWNNPYGLGKLPTPPWVTSPIYAYPPMPGQGQATTPAPLPMPMPGP